MAEGHRQRLKSRFLQSGLDGFNEINTLPGFTSISMYPKLMAACGKEGSQLIEELIKYAFERAGKDV